MAADHEDETETAAGKPVFVGCGATDRVIPPERTERAADLLAEASAEVRLERYGVGHGTTPGGGHRRRRVGRRPVLSGLGAATAMRNAFD